MTLNKKEFIISIHDCVWKAPSSYFGIGKIQIENKMKLIINVFCSTTSSMRHIMNQQIASVIIFGVLK